MIYCRLSLIDSFNLSVYNYVTTNASHTVYMHLYILLALSQKGDPLDSFKVLAVRPVVDQASGRTYYIVDIRWLNK